MVESDQGLPLQRVVAVDPGSKLGISCLEFDYASEKIVVLEAHTCYLNNLANIHYEEVMAVHGMQIARILIIDELLSKYVTDWNADHTVHETAYSSHGRNGGVSGSLESYAVARENILGIRLAFARALADKKPIAINPSTVKYCVVGVKNDDKDQVKKALQAKDDLDLSLINIDKLDQHAIDAIAIGYTFITKNILEAKHRECPQRSNISKGNKTKSTGR